jgi:trk system potassium uptake protein TrkH
MRTDVLNMILGYTLALLTIPIVSIGLVSCFIDSWQFAAVTFGIPALMCGSLAGLMIGTFTRTDSKNRVRDREAFVAVGLMYPIAVLISAIPFWFGGMFVGPFEEGATLNEMLQGAAFSWFEAMSGYTTTGATVIDISTSPVCFTMTAADDCIFAQSRGLLLWRSMTQWLGGMGIIMLGMMILSSKIGGGMALARAELTGPTVSKLHPSFRQTAYALWGLYFICTMMLFLLLFGIGDLSFFDAVNHALTTMPTGGFSVHDDSIGFYNSAIVETIIIVFMVIAGINFTLIWLMTHKRAKEAISDEELKSFFLYLFTATTIIFLVLYKWQGDWQGSIRSGLFNVVSIGTSTGFGTDDYVLWPVATHVILFFLMIIGASAGSTGGGLKILRIGLAAKLARREISKIAQPRKVHQIRYNNKPIDDSYLSLIIGMLLVWVGLFAFSSLILAFYMPDSSLETIVSIVASSLGNTGPALGDYGPSSTWESMPIPVLIFTSILMWFGRLELLTAILLLSFKTWKKEAKSDAEIQGIALVKKILQGKENND